jgi:FkbM family methyltransferase
MSMLANYLAGLRSLRAHGSGLAAHRLLYRVLAWRMWRMVGGRPIVPLHARSRIRLDAKPGEHGVRAGIFIFRDGFEPSVRDAIDRFVTPGACCYDIGANLGLWTLRMAERATDAGCVHAFEPLSRNIRNLEESIALSCAANIRVQPFALGRADEMAYLYVPDDVGRSSLAPESASDERESVRVRRLDDVWTEQGKPHVAFVKMDVEGAEPLVLDGGRAFFEATRPVTCCELNPGKLRNLGFAPAAVLDAFSAWRYDALAWSNRDRALVPFEPSSDCDEVRDLVFIPSA